MGPLVHLDQLARHHPPSVGNPLRRLACPIIRSLKLPSIALHLVETKFYSGFESHSPASSSKPSRPNGLSRDALPRRSQCSWVFLFDMHHSALRKEIFRPHANTKSSQQQIFCRIKRLHDPQLCAPGISSELVMGCTQDKLSQAVHVDVLSAAVPSFSVERLKCLR
jgi:hypothetical protein